MPPLVVHGYTLTRLRGTKVDDGYGGTTIDWDDPDRLDIEGCGLAPRVEDELAARGRQGVNVGWTAYLPFGADVTFEDRMETPYGVLDVEGEAGQWKSPYTGREAGMTVALNRVEG